MQQNIRLVGKKGLLTLNIKEVKYRGMNFNLQASLNTDIGLFPLDRD